MELDMIAAKLPKKSEDMSTSTGNSEQKNGLKRVNKSNSTGMKRRYRGKRKPKRKENRRRARPGRSRSGFRAIGAPLNNNEFLINQRDVTARGKQSEYSQYTGIGDKDSDVDKDDKEQSFTHFHEGRNRLATSLEMSKHFGVTCYGQDSTAHSTSSRSAETSDYESLHSPTESSSSSGSSYHWEEEHLEENLNDELFDADFAMRNFEADYSAHQQEMKEQLINLPRQQLEMRCSLLMDQLKDLEERSRMMCGMGRIKKLELELESLRKENRQLRGVTADSLAAE